MTDAQVERIAEAIEMLAAAVAGKLAPPPSDVPEGACSHPKELREDTGSTMGRLRWRCTGCGHSVDEAMGVAARAAQG